MLGGPEIQLPALLMQLPSGVHQVVSVEAGRPGMQREVAEDTVEDRHQALAVLLAGKVEAGVARTTGEGSAMQPHSTPHGT